METRPLSAKPIVQGDMVAFKIEGIYVTARVTRIMPRGFLVKTNEGHLSVQEHVEPTRNASETDALIRKIAGLPAR